MRPLLFVLGITFVATVLFADVAAVKCYAEVTGQPREVVDCEQFAKTGPPKHRDKVDTSKCIKFDRYANGERRTYRLAPLSSSSVCEPRLEPVV